MTITISSWIIPVGLTLMFLWLMSRDSKPTGWYDFSALFAFLWVVPMLLVWVIYFGILLWIKS